MVEHSIEVRVKYADTDQMGYVYYGRYLEYLELARTEAIREIGISYRDLELKYQVALPVMEVNIRYLHPAKYDDVITLKTTVKEKPGVRIKFHTEIIRNDGKLLNVADVKLCFVDITSGRPVKPPEAFMSCLANYFE